MYFFNKIKKIYMKITSVILQVIFNCTQNLLLYCFLNHRKIYIFDISMAILVSYKIRAEIKINTISQKLCRICLFNSSSPARQRASPCFLNFSGIRETKKTEKNMPMDPKKYLSRFFDSCTTFGLRIFFTQKFCF